jgi:hypothetical protein
VSTSVPLKEAAKAEAENSSEIAKNFFMRLAYTNHVTSLCDISHGSP